MKNKKNGRDGIENFINGLDGIENFFNGLEGMENFFNGLDGMENFVRKNILIPAGACVSVHGGVSCKSLLCVCGINSGRSTFKDSSNIH